MEIIRRAADPECSQRLVEAISIIDTVLAIPGLSRPLKSLFGLADLEHDDDFVSLLTVSHRPFSLLWFAFNAIHISAESFGLMAG